MKKLILFIFLMSYSVSHAQNVVIQNNGKTEQSNSTDDTSYYINGISTREDVGGVETTWKTVNSSDYRIIVFKNYNDFSVSVIYEIIDSNVGNLVLGAGEEKTVNTGIYYRDNVPLSVRLIARRLNGGVASISASRPTAQFPIIGGYLVKYPDSMGWMDSFQASEALIRLNERRAYGYDHWRLPADEIEARLVCSGDSRDVLTRKTKDPYESLILIPVCNVQNN